MKKSSCLLLGLLIGVCGPARNTTASALPAELDEYEFRAALSGSWETGKLFKARLAADVLDGFKSFPLDVRVVDRDGAIWPSVVFARPDRGGMMPIRVSARGRMESELDISYTVKEFMVEPERRGGNIPVHNRVVVHLGGQEFIRRMEVWGGPDINRLVLLGSGFLIEQKSPTQVRNRAVDYPDSTAPLLVVRVFNDARNADAPLDWRNTDVIRVLRDDADHELVELKKMSSPADEPVPPGVMFLHLDTGARNRPLLYLNLETSEKNFAFPVRVFGRNTQTNAWRWVADGGIHDIAGHQQKRIALTKSDYRYLKVEIYHYAERAPKIGDITAGAIPHYLVFSPLADKKAYVYFGSTRYQLPVSDFSRRITAETIADIKEASLSRSHVNPTRVASSLHAYGSTLMRFGLGIVILLVAVVSIRIIRHRYY